jgi:hypothetical protein
MRLDESIDYHNSQPENKVKLNRKIIAEDKSIFPTTEPPTNTTTLSNWNRLIYKPSPTVEQLNALADRLKVSLDYLMYRSGNPKKC